MPSSKDPMMAMAPMQKMSEAVISPSVKPVSLERTRALKRVASRSKSPSRSSSSPSSPPRSTLKIRIRMLSTLRAICTPMSRTQSPRPWNTMVRTRSGKRPCRSAPMRLPAMMAAALTREPVGSMDISLLLQATRRG